MLLTVTGCHTPDALNTPGLSWRPIACIFGMTGLGSPASLASEEQRAGRGEGATAGRRADLRTRALERQAAEGLWRWHPRLQITGTPEPLQLLKSLFTERRALG